MARSSAAAAQVRDALARAREAERALARRPAREVLAGLAQALDLLRDPAAPPHQELLRSLPEATGFSPEVVREGLRVALSEWTGETLLRAVESELGPGLGETGPRHARGFPTTAVLLAGALPCPTLAALLAPLALRSGVVAKPSLHDPCTARVLAETLLGVDPGLGASLQVVEFRSEEDPATEALLQADCVVASGSDATMARVARGVAPPRRFVAYGHRVSVAVLGPTAASHEGLDEAAAALAMDVSLWDQLGCLSPVAVYLLGTRGRVPEITLESFANAFTNIEKTLPRGRVALQAASDWAAERDAAELRAASGKGVALRTGAGFTVVAEADAAWRGSPLHRFLRIHPVPDLESLEAALHPIAPHLAAVGVAGLDEAARRALARSGASRICPLGRMQAPPLAWCHDGRPWLLPLARLCELEDG